MHNNFELNETTGVGLIKDDNDNNILIKTDANEEQLTELLEKENKIESNQNKIKHIKHEINKIDINIFSKIMAYITNIYLLIKFKAYYEAIQVIFEDWLFLVKLIGIFFLVMQPTILLINLKMKTFKYNFNKRNMLAKEIQFCEERIIDLSKELENLKSEVQIKEMNTNDVVTSSINYPIRSEEEKNNDYVNVQSGPVKFKSLRKEFEK